MRRTWRAQSDTAKAAIQELAQVYWADRVAKGWAKGSRIDDDWLAAPENRVAEVLGDA